MAKITKRAKKFSQKGGPKAMLDKKKGATITKKGKLKGRSAGNKQSDSGRGDDGSKKTMSSSRNEAAERERAENDFFGSHEESLGHLDMDSFFKEFTKSEQGKQDQDHDDDDDDDNDDGSDSDSENSGNSKNDQDDDDDDSDDMASLGSEEEDIEASEARMKAELQKLGEKDPEFLEYLKENESGLLDFGNDDDDDDGEEDMIDDEQDGDAEKKEQKQKQGKKKTSKSKTDQEKEQDDPFLLTPARLTSLETSAFTSHSLKGLKRILAAYRTACHLGDPSKQESNRGGRDEESEDYDDEDNGAGKNKKRKNNKREFHITSPVVFDRLMATSLMNCQEEFHYHLLGVGASGKGGAEGSKKANKSKKRNNDDNESDSDSDGDDDSPTNTHLDENKPIHPKQLRKSPHYTTLHPYMESFFKSTLHLLTETGKEPRLQKFVLSALSKYVPYLASFPRSSKPLLKACVKLWSAPLDTSEDYQMVRLQAFLRIRQLAITQPFPFIEDCLKTTYLSYAQRSKFGTASNVTTVLPTLTFMGNCIVELYTLDYASAYQHAFVYIRQLALHLRTALMKKSPETVSAVYCWQYVHCLKLWVAVLSAAVGGKGSTASVAHRDRSDDNVAGEDDDGEKNEGNNSKLGGGAGKDDEANLLKSLVYPLTEIILGVVRLIPIARYAPLRLHCVRLLQQLAASTECFIPTTNILLGILDMKEIGMKPLRDGGGKGGKSRKGGGKGGGGVGASKNTIRGLRLPLILKLPKEGTMRTMEQLDGVLKEVFVLLNREVDLYRYSPGFPEFSFQIVQRLRKFNKEINNGRWRAYSKGTIELCEKYSTFATQARSTLVDAPKDVRRLEALKPSNTPSMRDRYDAAVAKEKRLEAATQPMIASSAKNRGKDREEAKKKNVTKKKRKNESDDEGADISLNSDDDDKEFEEEDDEDVEVAKKKKKSSKQSKKKKKVAVVNEADLKNVDALKEKDEVQEGIVWSDSE
ncbi:hypothetical protein ACHAXS_008660 [Conticribra weissflogii]